MTPEDRQMIAGLFDRMRQQGNIEKDRDAEALIRDSVRQTPDAPYMMVQTVLVQEMALQNAQQQIDDLQERVRSLEAQAARPQQSSSFLGGLFGGSRAAPQPAPSAVPPSRPAGAMGQSAGFGGAPARQGSPWGGAPGAGAPMQGGMMQQPQPAAGGSFMRTAMATAAGVAGGMLAANAISSMMNGGSSAQAAPASAGQSGNDPAGSYDAAQSDQSGGYDNDPAGSYSAADDSAGYDDGGGWSEE